LLQQLCHSFSDETNYSFHLINIRRAGVAQYMKTEWRLVAIFNVVLFVVLISSLLSTRFDSEQSFGLLNGLVQISNITFKDCQTTTVPKQF